MVKRFKVRGFYSLPSGPRIVRFFPQFVRPSPLATRSLRTPFVSASGVPAAPKERMRCE